MPTSEVRVVGALLWYVVYCVAVVIVVIAAMRSGFPVGRVAKLGVYAVSAGAIVAVLARYLAGR